MTPTVTRTNTERVCKLAVKYSPNAVAKVVKSGSSLSIKYAHEGFSKIYLFDEKVSVSPCLRSVLFRVRRINSRNLLTHKILEEVIKRQRRYLETADPLDLVPLRQVQLPFDNSWVCRLVSGLSVITPSGEEKPLKWFFPTRQDVNKRLIKQLLDKESEDLQSGKLKKPYTDNELRVLLETFFSTNYELRTPLEKIFLTGRTKNYSLSRHSIGHCRKDMGIPPAGRRLSGYKYPPLSANFSMIYPLTMESVIKNSPETSGIYELSVKSREAKKQRSKEVKKNLCVFASLPLVSYPVSNVIYIGSTKNIKKRLREHLGKNSKNGRIRDFLEKHECSFRYIQFQRNWQEEEKKLYGLFVTTYGAPPKCNRVSPGGN